MHNVVIDAGVGQWIDSPSGRIARTKGIDAAWQQLWQAQNGAHVEDALRNAFLEDYHTWQAIKEQIANMGVISLMSPPTGDLLERWDVRQRDWYARMHEAQVPIAAPPVRVPTPEPPPLLTGASKLAWALAGLVASGAFLMLASKWASRPSATPRAA
jgi:hypothetical protein